MMEIHDGFCRSRSSTRSTSRRTLAPILEVMDRDAKRMRGRRPFLFTHLKTGEQLGQVIEFLEHTGGPSEAQTRMGVG
jgi:urease accessory protein